MYGCAQLQVVAYGNDAAFARGGFAEYFPVQAGQLAVVELQHPAGGEAMFFLAKTTIGQFF